MPARGYVVKISVEVERETEHDFDDAISINRTFDLPPDVGSVGKAFDAVRNNVVGQLEFPERDRDTETPSAASGEV